MLRINQAIYDWALSHHWQPIEYKQPIVSYDPFEVFKPSKAFLKEVIKQLKQRCYEIIEAGNQNQADKILLEPTLEGLNRRIRDYQYRLQGVPKTRPGNIGPDLIAQAKRAPIQDYFTGRLRRSGKDLVGICPFHEDRKPSLTLYNNGNRFKCFSCGATGDTIDFVSKTQHLTFIQAIKYILKI